MSTYDIKKIRDKHNFAVHLTTKTNSEDAIPQGINFTKELVILDQHLGQFPEPSQDVLKNSTNAENTISFISKNLKGVVYIPDNYFHYFSDFLGLVIIFLEKCNKESVKKIELIFCTSHKLQITKDFFPFLEYCIEKFRKNVSVEYTVADFTEYKYIKIDNFVKIPQADIGESIEDIYQAAVEFAECSTTRKPRRKVFLSRKQDKLKDNRASRSINQDEAEAFFKSLGFQIVYGEMFKSLKDQISYFNGVSVLAGFTGSGLTSSMFMQNGQTVIEVVCPIKFTQYENVYELHNFYKTISMLKNHKLLNVANINKSSEELIKDLTQISKIL